MLENFTIRPSKVFSILLILLYLFAIQSVLLVSFPRYLQLALCGVLFLSLLQQLFQHVFLRAQSSWRSFAITERQLTLVTQDGTELNGEVMASSVVTPFCVFLSIRLEGQFLPVSQAIFFDAMDKEAFRALRVQLKYT